MLEAIATLFFGILFFHWGTRLGRVLVRNGATAANIFQGKNVVSLVVLVLYLGVMLVAFTVPQLRALPLEWRTYGMQVTYTMLRVVLLGFCGLAFTVAWKTARSQVLAVALLGVLGLGGFTATEAYFLAPIYGELSNNLQPNGVYKQTSFSSCAPSALATVLRRWQIEATESSVAKLANTSRLGTFNPQLVVAARGYGFDAIELTATWEQIQRINRPGVLSVWQLAGGQKLAHAVAVLAINSTHILIGDPAPGELLLLDRQQFAQIDRQQYLPLFRPEEIMLTAHTTADYLRRSGYPEATAENLGSALGAFQQSMRISATGVSDIQTRLLLMGPYLDQVPTLNWP
jgi:Peptidase C39 family